MSRAIDDTTALPTPEQVAALQRLIAEQVDTCDSHESVALTTDDPYAVDHAEQHARDAGLWRMLAAALPALVERARRAPNMDECVVSDSDYIDLTSDSAEYRGAQEEIAEFLGGDTSGLTLMEHVRDTVEDLRARLAEAEALTVDLRLRAEDAEKALLSEAMEGIKPATQHAGRWRKLPVVVDAFRWMARTGGDWAALDAWLVSLGYKTTDEADGDDDVPMWVNGDDSLTIPTLEGDMRCDIGDWVIRGVKGEFCPCKPNVFSLTYESADALEAPTTAQFAALREENARPAAVWQAVLEGKVWKEFGRWCYRKPGTELVYDVPTVEEALAAYRAALSPSRTPESSASEAGNG